MMRKLFLPVALLLICSLNAYAQELIKPGVTLSLQRCIEIALQKHPAIAAASGSLKASQSRIGQARAGYYPQINWISYYNRTAPASSSLLRGSTDPYDQYSSAVSLNQMIYDFEKTTSQVKIQRLGADASQADLEDMLAQIVLGVKKAYFGLLQSERNRETTGETVKQFQQHLDQAKGFFEIGTRPKSDVTKAEVDLSNARLNLLKAENAVRIARVTLSNAMGISGATDYRIEDILAFKRFAIGPEEALKQAYEARQDLRSMTAKREAAERSISLAKNNYYPVLSGNAGYGWSGEDFPLQRGWNVGATLTFPLFSGLSTNYQVDEARANLEVLKANEEALRQSIRLDVQQAFLNLQEAADVIVVAELAVRQATENFDLANGRYGAGVGSPIEVTDALVSLSNAKDAYNTSFYGYKIAQATLEKSMGLKP